MTLQWAPLLHFVRLMNRRWFLGIAHRSKFSSSDEICVWLDTDMTNFVSNIVGKVAHENNGHDLQHIVCRLEGQCPAELALAPRVLQRDG